MDSSNTKEQLSDRGDPVQVQVEDIGGIDECSVTITKGINILTGRNATNRTSFLRAIAAALGGTVASVKSDSDEGRIRMTTEREVYTRNLHSSDMETQLSGSPASDNSTLIDLFVAVLEDNATRRRVEQAGDVRGLIMEPVDTEAINQRISKLKQDKKELESKRKRVKKQRQRLPKLEERRRNYEEKIKSVDNQLAELRQNVSQFEADTSSAEQADQLANELEEARQNLKATDEKIETLTTEINALDKEIDELRQERDNLPEYTRSDLGDIQKNLKRLREQKRDVEEKANTITTVIQFNKDMLDEDSSLFSNTKDTSNEAIEQLAPEQDRSVQCWTCGSSVDQGEISEQIGSLRTILQETRSKKTDIETEISEQRSQEQKIKEAIDRQNTINKRIDTLESKIENKEARIMDLDKNKQQLREQIVELENQVAKTENLRDNDILEMYEEISELEYRRGELSQQIEDINADIDEIQNLSETAVLDEKISEVKKKIEDERTRIESLEKETVQRFNDHMSEVLGILEYQNIERVWIERISKGTNTTFEIHVIREDASGSVYEDAVDNLSESEREVIGLVVALAGYLVHEVYKEVPFILLDSLEAIDGRRIADLISYFSEYTSYLVVALLPEDADKVSNEHHYISSDIL